ncbi:hypothetical protein ES703_22917 [subsurface metagenome]
MRVLHFLEHGLESVDSNLIRFFTVGDPVVGQGEDGDATLDQFFSGRPMVVEDPVGTYSGVCPDDVRENKKQRQYGDSDRY